MEIKKCTLDFIDEVYEIEKETFSRPWSKNLFLQELGVDHGFFYVCIEENHIIAYIIARLIIDEMAIMNLAVKEEFRRQKVAEKLLLKILSVKDASIFSLEVRKSNEAAIKLYEKYGFKVVGIRKDYYESPKEDGFFMIRTE